MDNLDILKNGEKIEEKIFFQLKLLEAVNDSIVVANHQGIITYWNKGSERLFGWSSEEVIGKAFWLLFEESNVKNISTHLNEVQMGIWEGKVPILTKLGEKKYARVSVTAMYDRENKPTNLVGVFTDITEIIKSKIEAEEALRSKSEFLANVSHEIRTPMTGILGYVELLGNLPLDDKQKQYLQAIKENATQLLDLINDILDLSKMEANKMLLEENSFNLRDLIYASTKIFEPTINNKNLLLSIDISSDLPDNIISDSVKIKQILSNLLSNAVKFTQEGTIDIHVYKGKVLEDNKFELCIEVEDTGIGIPTDKIPMLFEPFVQADSSTTRKFGGTGLGLAICKKLLELLGGNIKVESEPGRGSKFMFRIPVAETSTTSKGDIYIARNTEHNLYKLLLISPDEDLFNEINQALVDTDLEILWAKNINRIMSIISFYEPDIMLIDLINLINYQDLQQIEFVSLPPSIKLYILTAESDEIFRLSIPHNMSVKYMNSLEEILKDLHSFSIVEENTASPALDNILLIDENKVSLMLIYNILSNHGYSVARNSNIVTLPDDIGPFNIVLVDTSVIEKHGQAAVNKLQQIKCEVLVGISSNEEVTYQRDIFADFIYKPVTTNKLLAIVSKYLGGKDH